MVIWFWSDTHFGHGKIIEYCNRPFKSLVEMDETLIQRFNERVDIDDLCFFLGDFCMKKSTEASDAPQKAFDYYRNQLKCKNIIFIDGNHDCFSKETCLLTCDGYKKYTELKIGELIPSLNLTTNKVEFQPIEKITTSFFENKYVLKSTSFEAEVSKNHKLLLTTCTDKTHLFFEKCSDAWKRKAYIQIPTAVPSNNKQYPISNNLLEILGWIYTDGGISKRGYVKLYQSKKETSIKIEKLLNILAMDYYHCKRNRKIKEIMGKKIKNCLPQNEYHIHSESSLILLKKLKITSKYEVPNWLKKCSDKQIELLISTMVSGDGCIQNSGSRVIWGNREFLSKIMGICVTHNLDCNLVTAKNRGFYLCIHTDKKMQHTREIQPYHRTIQPYNDLMWCVTVKNHTLFTELHGKPMISGNSNNGTKTPIESINIEHGGNVIHLTHNPKHANEDYKFNYCGHCHGNEGTFRKLGKKSVIVDISVENWNYSPITINEINGAYSAWLKSGKAR